MPNSKQAAWNGHKAATSYVLIDLLIKAQTEGAGFSQSQRILFTACEFWAASQNGSLLSLLGDAIDFQLQAAEASFRAIGLPKTVNILTRARVQLFSLHCPVSIEHVVADIENALAAVDESVDEAIEAFAKRELTESR